MDFRGRCAGWRMAEIEACMTTPELEDLRCRYTITLRYCLRDVAAYQCFMDRLQLIGSNPVVDMTVTDMEITRWLIVDYVLAIEACDLKLEDVDPETGCLDPFFEVPDRTSPVLWRDAWYTADLPEMCCYPFAPVTPLDCGADTRYAPTSE